MNIELLNEVVRKFHLGEFHDENTKPEDRKIFNVETLKYAPYLCFCDIQDNEVEVLYDYSLEVGNVTRINTKVRELESQGKIFEAFVQLAYLTQIKAKKATNYRIKEGLEVFPTDYENYVAYTQILVDFGEELKRSKESFDRFVVSFANDLKEGFAKQKLEQEKLAKQNKEE